MPSSRLSERLKSLNVADGDDVEDSLVISIDFGTTYSGVAWATRVDFGNGNINFIHSWPGNGREEGKVPTEFWYGNDKEPSWGYEIPDDVNPFRWFKLLLLHAEDLDDDVRESKFVIRAQDMLENCGKSAVELVADYLRLVWKHTMSTIERARGDAVVEALPIHVVITVPAIWKGYARQAMEDAAKMAGILDYRLAGTTRLTFVPEPEAAALSTLLEQGSGARTGNVYVICDAGGGTVDLISYEVNRVDPIVLREAVEGTGGLCGAIFIDQAFEHMCCGRLGSRGIKLNKTCLKQIMKGEWEYGIKPQFRLGKPEKEYIVSVPAEAFGQSLLGLNDSKREPYIKNGRIYFKGYHIERTFEDIVYSIQDLVDGQIEKAKEKGLSVTGVILVGGLGGSPYLYEYLKALYSEVGISLLQPGGTKSRTAICRGAAIKGLLEDQYKERGAEAPITIESTISRASYGITYMTRFEPLKHLEEDKKWNEHEAEWSASNQMKWHLQRGQNASKTKPVRASWCSLYRQCEFNGTLRLTLFECDERIPPSRKSSNVKPVGTLCCKLDIQYSDLPEFDSKAGGVVKILQYEIELVPSGASIEFVLYVDGRKQGGQSVKIRLK
ncbi:hypothetical protein NUW58_g769 [Xylaria curta]|uniref:Uncharacterized protein n=1 Tax=Xylaria curta TaxID=42375 RepID=A0ACC1PQM1_9PEZI|nr:hypothetical protein NUW58_g769 [Xylaria curta]